MEVRQESNGHRTVAQSDASAPASDHNSDCGPSTVSLPTSLPVVFLVLGYRGSGKTSVSKCLAAKYNLLHISSDDACCSGKHPFIELRAKLQEEFGTGGKRRYCGVVLDRFIAYSEFDAFYIQSALNAVDLPVPLVFLLDIDTELAAQRANNQERNNVASGFAQAVERKAQIVTSSTVYAPIARFRNICVTEDKCVQMVVDEITATVAAIEFTPEWAGARLPHFARRESYGTRLVQDYETFMELANDVHLAVGNVHGRRDSAPLSSVGAYLSKEYFSFARKDLRSLLSTMSVTLKADGERMLLVKHRKYGFIGFPAAFTHCYVLNGLFEGVEMGRPSLPDFTKKSVETSHEGVVEFLLDTEIVVRDSRPTLFVMDFIYFWGLEGKRVRFGQRLAVLRDYFTGLESAAHVIVLKDYVAINKARTLVNTIKTGSELPVDGLIFQHDGVYRFGRDKLLIKWKPMELCTADFRITNGVQTHGEWTFSLMVTDDLTKETNFGETVYPNAICRIPSNVVEEHALADGMVVELALVDCVRLVGRRDDEVREWAFRGVRNDKTSPNKYSIVKKIVELEHLGLEELASLCEGVPFHGAA
ncbi:putative RNA guanylyltransferase [Trypanosoma vivax]|nr:putative RNA guanylyltransferase [Trypanosoma vivax]